MTILDTERLLLRPFHTNDTSNVVAYATQEMFWRFLPIGVQTAATVTAFVAERAAGGHPDAKYNWHFAAESKEAGRVVGSFRIGVRDSDHRQADIGYALDPQCWGRGLATEGVWAVLTFGFNELALERIAATADANNQASWKVMERVGMQREGLLRHHRLVRGAWRDSVLYAILREDFTAARG